MNKCLLVWNIIITIIMVGLMVNGCSSIDPEFANLSTQVKSNRAVVEQLANGVNENRKLIASNTQAILESKIYTETVINQLGK